MQIAKELAKKSHFANKGRLKVVESKKMSDKMILLTVFLFHFFMLWRMVALDWLSWLSGGQRIAVVTTEERKAELVNLIYPQ